MPLEGATYIKDLNADWPIGKSDMVSGGDDQIRMMKSVLQNTLPSADGAITGTPEQINNITLNTPWQDNSATAGALSYFQLNDPTVASGDDAELAALALATPTVTQYNATPALSLTWQALIDILYPVGTVYENASDNRNPSDILGFGTWVAMPGVAYGVGTLTDRGDSSKTWTVAAGAVAGRLYVNAANIVPITPTATFAGTAVPDHTHGIPIYSGDQAGGKVADGTDAQSSTAQTNGAGGHTPAGKVTVSAVGTGSEIMNAPGYATYRWTRTA